jgi:hypothetical protein
MDSKDINDNNKEEDLGKDSSLDVSGSLIIKSEKNSIRNYMIGKLQVSGIYNKTYTPTGSNYQST